MERSPHVYQVTAYQFLLLLPKNMMGLILWADMERRSEAQEILLGEMPVKEKRMKSKNRTKKLQITMQLWSPWKEHGKTDLSRKSFRPQNCSERDSARPRSHLWAKPVQERMPTSGRHSLELAPSPYSDTGWKLPSGRMASLFTGCWIQRCGGWAVRQLCPAWRMILKEHLWLPQCISCPVQIKFSGVPLALSSRGET